MEEAQLVPDVLDKEPSSLLTVHFGKTEVQLGDKLSIEKVSKQPTLVDWDGKPGCFYMLCFTDPDAPSRDNPAVREWIHWVVVNIPGDSKDISLGETLVDFVPSCPGVNTGIHRYTFVLFQQPSFQDFSSERKFDKSIEHRVLRRNFSVQKFAQKYMMGDAIAGNYFTTEWDPYVTEVRRQLGLE